MKKIVILISGRGSNMQALLAHAEHYQVAAVISNRADATGLDFAQAQGIATHTIPHKDYPNREAFDTELARVIDNYQPDFVVLAGFMRILTAPFVAHFQRRIINIHPSLLPAYPGIDTHLRALQDGIKIHGCTVHFVTTELDSGPIIIQAAITVMQSDTPETLAARILEEEHRIYPQALNWLCSGKVRLSEHDQVINTIPETLTSALISPVLI